MTQRIHHESVDEYYARLRERSEREDLVMFINTGFAATKQCEYHTDRYERSVSIDFLHQYVLDPRSPRLGYVTPRTLRRCWALPGSPAVRRPWPSWSRILPRA